MGRQLSALVGLLVLLAMMAAPVAAQAQTAQTAQSVLQAAAKAMGTNNLKCVTYTGAGYVGIVGQNHDIRDDWPRVGTGRLHPDDQLRRPVLAGGARHPAGQLSRARRRRHSDPGRAAADAVRRRQDRLERRARTAMPAPAPAAAELRQLDIWLNPHGFIKAAMAPGANPVLITR